MEKGQSKQTLSVEELNQVTTFKGECFVQSYLDIATIFQYCFLRPLLVKCSLPFEEERHLVFHNQAQKYATSCEVTVSIYVRGEKSD